MATALRAASVEQWTLLVDAVGHSGSENMAIDESLLHAADRNGTAALRLYRWAPPCLSLGRNEPALARYDRARIDQRGLDVVRRPTGGRAVWHEHEVTYAVAAPIAAFGSLPESYLRIHERLAEALRRLGVPAQLASRYRLPGLDSTPGACFAAPVGGEIVVHGRKVAGSAQVRLGSAFLQHGSILLDGSQDMVTAVSRQPSAVSSATTLASVLGRSVSFAEVTEAILASWGETTAPTPARLCSPAPARFSDPAWTWRR